MTVTTKHQDDDGAREPEAGYVLGAVLIAGLVLPQLPVLGGLIVESQGRIWEFYVGAYILYIGLLFLSSYYWSHKTFVLRGFMWMCENLSSPSGRRMAFFYFALCTFLGGMAMLAGCGMVRMRH